MTAKKPEAKVTGDLASRLTVLEERVTALERQARKVKRATRRKHEYTQEERASIRKRLLAGQEAARKKRENGAAKVTKKVRPANSKKGRAVVAEKPVEA